MRKACFSSFCEPTFWFHVVFLHPSCKIIPSEWTSRQVPSNWDPNAHEILSSPHERPSMRISSKLLCSLHIFPTVLSFLLKTHRSKPPGELATILWIHVSMLLQPCHFLLSLFPRFHLPPPCKCLDYFLCHLPKGGRCSSPGSAQRRDQPLL